MAEERIRTTTVDVFAPQTRKIVAGQLPWEVLRFGTPLAIGMAFQVTFNLVDAYLIARLPIERAGPAIGAAGGVTGIGSTAVVGIGTLWSASHAGDASRIGVFSPTT